MGKGIGLTVLKTDIPFMQQTGAHKGDSKDLLVESWECVGALSCRRELNTSSILGHPAKTGNNAQTRI